MLCPFKGGALKPVAEYPNKWAHVTCATLIPETSFQDDALIEPVVGIDRIDKQRWNLRCSICAKNGRKDIGGACIQCSYGKCTVALHPLCCHSNLLVRLECSSREWMFKPYCEQHFKLLPPEPIDENFELVNVSSFASISRNSSAKSNRSGHSRKQRIIISNELTEDPGEDGW
jgi:hypothetical protein